MHKEFTLVTRNEAIARYQVDAFIYESREAFMDQVEEDTYFYIHEGDLTLTGNFVLDLERTEKGEYINGFIIIGNLDVSGNIVNDEGDYGPVLYVAGNVSCQSMLIGGSPVRVTGNVTAREVILLYYNHGWMQCDGVFRAPVMLVDDYYLMPGKKEITLFYYNDRNPASPEENEYAEDEDGDRIFSPRLRALLNNPLTTDVEELGRDLANGELVLASQERDAAWWAMKVGKNYRDLKRVPMAFRTRELCMQAMSHCIQALTWFPREYINEALAFEAAAKNGMALRYLPDELITRALCYLAVKHGGLLRTDIPERLYEPQLLEMAIMVKDFQMEFIPVEMITKKLLVTYVKQGRGAWLDRYCSQSGVSKQEVLQEVIDSGIKYVENIFNWHLSVDTYAYAKHCYDNPEYQEEWEGLVQRFARKIGRIRIE
ncbi:hypothetical protein [Chitinophaga sp. 212800010-3]|uniref:hypothetical protein n=1 Tax=unclassified Chitinophaga TaxID=2619133 RepID=UPI002DF607B1|nr:Polymer-forming cytoskeletal protein [Chitinophaga sp. 212800010-3]